MKRIALIFAGLALLSATPAAAQIRLPGLGIDIGVNIGGGSRAMPAQPVMMQRLAPRDIYAIIQRMTPGRQLNTSVERSDGRAVYFVRWQTDDGRRIDYVIDGNTGAVLSRNGA